MEFQERICKFCLEKCENFKAIDENTKNVLDLLLLNIDLTSTRESVMCKNCTEVLAKCCDFKSTCLRTKDFIVPFVNKTDNARLDLNDVYLSKDITGTGISEDQDICGFCIGLVRKCSALSLDADKGDVMLKQMIELCLPELDLSIFKKLVICISCYGSLKSYFSFVMNCLPEENIKINYDTLDRNNKSQIELSNLIQVTTNDLDGTSVDTINVEEQFFDYRKNPNKVKVFNGGVTKLEQIYFNDTKYHIEGVENFTKIDSQTVNNEHPLEPNNKLVSEQESDKFGSTKKEELFCEDGETKHKVKISQKFLLEEINIKTDQQDSSRFEDAGFSPHLVVPTTLCSSSKCFMSKLKGSLSKSEIKHRLPNKRISKITLNYCERCSFQTKYKSYLKRHLLVHKDPSEVTMHKCDSCSFETKHLSNLRKHLLLHKDLSELTMHKCEYCLYQTKNIKNLKRHLLVHKDSSELTMHKCDSCSFTTKRKEDLKRHLQTRKHLKDPLEVTVYKCDACVYQTKNIKNLKRHLLVHKDPLEAKMHKCSSCSFQTKRKQDLKRHLLNHKEPSEITMYKCDSCLFQTKCKQVLKMHLLKHKELSEVTIYKCETCSFQTRNKYYWKRHEVTHKNL